VMHYNFIR